MGGSSKLPLALPHLLLVEYRFVILIWFAMYALVRQLVVSSTAGNDDDWATGGLYLQLQQCYSMVADNEMWGSGLFAKDCSINMPTRYTSSPNPRIKQIDNSQGVVIAAAANQCTLALMVAFYLCMVVWCIISRAYHCIDGQYLSFVLRVQQSWALRIFTAFLILYFIALSLYAWITVGNLDRNVLVNGTIALFDRSMYLVNDARVAIDFHSDDAAATKCRARNMRFNIKIYRLPFLDVTTIAQVIQQAILTDDPALFEGDAPLGVGIINSEASWTAPDRMQQLRDSIIKKSQTASGAVAAVAIHVPTAEMVMPKSDQN